MRRRGVLVWYFILAAMLAEAAVYGIAAGVAAYYQKAVRREFIAAASTWQEIDKVPFAAQINSAARGAGVSARLVAAVIQAESSFNPRALSPAGAAGLMQIIPGTWREVNAELKVCAGRHAGECTIQCYFDPELNIRIGTGYLSRLIRHYQGDVSLAIAAYNAGPGAVDRWGGLPPFLETQEYVERVMGYWYQFGKLPLPAGRLVAEHWLRIRGLAGWSLVGTTGILLLVARRLKKINRSWRWR
ncbi:MAG TPA: lytic transglycosylase domain-containing protein [Selenomonadales bacterium]|nr:lytic transglycosylase domain-containing protein [Selenomonadales bacterium]